MTPNNLSLIATHRRYLDSFGLAPSLLDLGPNPSGTDYFVGDLHGEGLLLSHALAKIRFNWNHDRLFAVGDIVDRGKSHRALFEMLMGKTNFYSVLGNHDVDAIDYLGDFLNFGKSLPNGDCNWTQDFSVNHLREIHRFLCEMPLTIRVCLKDGRRVGVLHADFPDELQAFSDLRLLSRDSLPIIRPHSALETLLWGRQRAQIAGDLLLAEDHSESHRLLDIGNDVDLILCGHSVTMTNRPVQAGQWMFLDTGSGYESTDSPDAFLSIVDPLSRRVVQAFHTQAGTIGTQEFMLDENIYTH